MKYFYAGNEAFIESVEGRLAEAGCQKVASIDSADAVLTYCTSQTALEDAYFDANGIVQAAEPGTLLIDLSASTVNFARELAAVATVSDLLYVEAPLAVADLMRADAFADADNLRCYVAGEADAKAGAWELLKPLAGTVIETGAAGTAQLARAAHSLQVSAQVVAAIEAEALYRTVLRSAMGCAGGEFEHPLVEVPAAKGVLDAVTIGAFTGTYTVEMFMAELSAALMTADDAELILPQAEAAMHLLELLAVIGGAEKAPSALALVYAEEADCAAQGLDWTRAENAFDDGCGCGCDHDHDHGDGCCGGHGHGHGDGCGCGGHDDDYDDDDYDDFDDFDYRCN